MPQYKIYWDEPKTAVVEADNEDDAISQIDTAGEISMVVEITKKIENKRR